MLPFMRTMLVLGGRLDFKLITYGLDIAMDLNKWVDFST
jgi:hypothetical protein